MSWALICGASGDIGSQIARDLAAKGWSLYLHYHHNQAKVTELVENLATTYPKQDFLPLQCDLTEVKNVEKLAQSIFGGLDAVIFAQGTTEYGLFSQLPPKKFAAMLNMQVQSPLRLLALLETKLAQSKAGRIVFIGSVYGGAGSSLEVAYSTIKGAQSAFCKAYSKEVASLDITVNTVAPGAVDTQMNQVFSENEKDEVCEEIPLGRFARPTEISYFVSMLLDEKASYLTGQTLYVTGGWLK
ncbi:elongation factor P 5-aminopentanone reductase [Ligilactobacillus apodemi]|uniref:3-oxoacyl-acyl carrier protein reductase n=1 Tax=Ligilactobacillus apodemi DSM 16634 = JCM 16172 TaxID=1423724 RepID=A0A0R1TYC1_9LACO|nr:SDR family oxidoreductase [Ligilactobacillus apodemi]KRL83557.1 3-oxoacyl-acyl carrier protein reductase [Ligilactobacillus apodemi DSM 16634 = JCM 16172]MBD5069694.1 SDR family oxidoreductase [Lactobacillus sp.]MCR1900409.1 SDR family oxidoreductase [Ligilactobacillus apodemi]